MTTPESKASGGYRDPSKEIQERVDDLLGRMTLEEKIAQTACPFAGGPAGIPTAPPSHAFGGSAWPVSISGERPPGGARVVNELQRLLVEGTRLGVPTLVNDEALCGLKIRTATVFPDALAQAATWDPPLIEEMARAIGEDMVAVGVRQAFAPLCDVARDPRWGRITETYGEDPFLVGSIATAYVRGLQGPNPLTGVIATLKHFIAYSGSEGGRNTHPTHVGPREVREVYGVPFEMAIRLAGARSIMCSYNQIDTVPVQGSHDVLTTLLRDEYGFDGIAISDLRSVERLSSTEGVAADVEEAVAMSLRAGLDLELADAPNTTQITSAVQHGRLDEADVDRAAATVLREKFRLGLFESPYVDETAVPDSLDSPGRRELSRRVAERSIVLLRNAAVDGSAVLPLRSDLRSIAVIGPNADRPFATLGTYSYPVLDTAVRRTRTVMDPTARTATETDLARPGRLTSDDIVPLVEYEPVVTVLAGIRARAGAKVDVRYATGCPIEVPETSGVAEAVDLARSSDVAIVVVGDQPGIGQGGTVGEHIDSATCALPGAQRQLVEAVGSAGTPTIVILTHGRPFVLGWMTQVAQAIVSGWFPGEEGSAALASVLFGDISPGGRTPVSFPPHSGILPAPYNRTYSGPSYYYDTTVEPVFPFGHGLGYTSFDYASLELSPEIATDGTATVSCLVTNSGERAGDEVVQLYTHDPVARSARPRRELKGFLRVSLEAGASALVTFELAADRFALYDPIVGWLVEPGRIEIMVGSSSEDVRLAGELLLTGSARKVGRDRVLVTPSEVRLC